MPELAMPSDVRSETHSGTAGARRRRSRRMLAALVPVAALGLSLVPAAPAAAKKDTPRPIVSGWLPYWTTNASIASMTANKDLLQEVSPFWYTVRPNATGTQAVIGTQVSTTSKAAVKTAAAQAGIALWPSFTDSFPARGLATIMSKPKKRAKLVDRMVSLAVAEGYAGLDLDFEKFAFNDGSSTWAATRPNWVQFVKELGTALHAHGKELAATTPPLCSMGGACGGRNGYWVYDWKGIAPYVDRLRIMAYDYSWSVPGPIGPYPWAEAIVAWAVTQVPSGKVQLGVPTYGREWVRRNKDGSYKITGTCPKDGSLPSNYLSKHTFDSVTVPSLLKSRGLTSADVQWDDTYKESFYRFSRTYKGGKNSCTVYREGWFGDARAVTARAGLVEKYQLSGVAAWTIGGEDPAQWSMLRNLARGIAPAATSVTAAAPGAVTYGQQGRVTVTARSQGVALDGAPVRLDWRANGSSSWQTLATGRTSSAGTATWTHKILSSGTFRAVVSGTWERNAGSALATTRVRPVLTPTTRSIAIARGAKAKLRAVLRPNAGQQVVVQQRIKKHWVKVANAKIGRAGNPHLGLRVTRSQAAYRFKVKSSPVSTSALSSVIKVRTR